MNLRRAAVIDLGTNTFHLMICEIANGQSNVIFKRRVPVKIGQGGISKGLIVDEAKSRALSTLKEFKQICEDYEVEEIHALATSAIRSASNGQDFCQQALIDTGIQINVIDGITEAEYILAGVKTAVDFTNDPSLIMDIGGGSVEFILATADQILFQNSYEIGAQRLKDKFHHSDPISVGEIQDLRNFLKSSLADLIEVSNIHKPVTLIGASGSFETVIDIYNKKDQNDSEYINLGEQFHKNCFTLVHQEILSKNHDERLRIPGMVEMRVDMICVATVLIDFILEELSIQQITVSSAALKEGLMVSLLEPIPAE